MAVWGKNGPFHMSNKGGWEFLVVLGDERVAYNNERNDECWGIILTAMFTHKVISIEYWCMTAHQFFFNFTAGGGGASWRANSPCWYSSCTTNSKDR